jgi:hypothetical protein
MAAALSVLYRDDIQQIDLFNFERLEEAFRFGIIVWIGSARHRETQFVVLS